MTQTNRIGVLVDLVAVCYTLMIHALPVSATVDFVRHGRKLGRVGRSVWIEMGIVALAILYAMAAHLMEIALLDGCVHSLR